ncbi:Uncharacterised protein [Salmonella enterica subsp. enterica serovar Typhimurium str. DT104]|nr:Uncharacterised protein [Salmonella enterica subsp. enterica serovar Typhimurium str. DT104]
MSHLHQLFGVRQNVTVVIRAAPGKQRPGFVGIDDAFVSAARFRRQLRAGEGVGYTVQRRGSALYHVAVHTGLIAVRAGDGGENDGGFSRKRRKVDRADNQRRFDAGAFLLGDHHRGVAVGVSDAAIFRLGGRELGIANANRVGVIDHTLAVFRIFTADDKRRVAFGRAVARFGGDGEGDAFPHLHF